MFNKDAFVVILQDRPICALKLVYLMTNALKIVAGEPEGKRRLRRLEGNLSGS
jgi:hypothetical protein